jgi:hypothetical protein
MLHKMAQALFAVILYQASIYWTVEALAFDFFAGVDVNGEVVGGEVGKRTGIVGIETRSLFCNFLPFASAVLAWRLQKMTSFRSYRERAEWVTWCGERT